MTIYQRIKSAAKQKNISIRELEHQLGFSNGSIRQWKDTVNTNKLKKVSDFLNVPLNYLIGENKKDSQVVDLNDLSTVMTFQGEPIPEKYKEIVRDLLRNLKEKEENDK